MNIINIDGEKIQTSRFLAPENTNVLIARPLKIQDALQSYAHTHGCSSIHIGTQRLYHVTGTSLYSVQYDAQCSVVRPTVQ